MRGTFSFLLVLFFAGYSFSQEGFVITDSAPSQKEKLKCILFVSDSCTSCVPLKKDIETVLAPIGWEIKIVRVEEYSDDFKKYAEVKNGEVTTPQIVVYTRQKKIASFVGGYLPPQKLAAWLNNCCYSSSVGWK